MLCSLGGVCSPPSMSVLQHSKPNFDSKVALEIPIHDGRDREQTNPSVQYRGGGRLRLCSASRSLRYSIPAGVKAIVC